MNFLAFLEWSAKFRRTNACLHSLSSLFPRRHYQVTSLNHLSVQRTKEVRVFGMLKRMIIFSCIFSLFLIFPSYFAAGLTKDEYEMMRVAFMNGYVRALRLDIETIQSLKRNKKELKKFVISEADRYMKEVLNLNI